MEIILIFLVYVIGSFIQGTTGFGFALFVMSFLPLFIPFPKVVLVVLLVSAFMTAQMTYRLRRHINLKFILVPLTAALAGRTIGIYILILYGNMSLEVLRLSLIGIAAVFIGSSIGIWLFRKIRKETLSKMVYTLMAVMGLVLIIR